MNSSQPFFLSTYLIFKIYVQTNTTPFNYFFFFESEVIFVNIM